jgi:hypothetical protein
MRPLDFGNAEQNVVLAVADTVVFMTTDFEAIKEYRTVEPWPEKSTLFNINRGVSFFTESNDSVLYYNYMNDTVYRVMSNCLSPRWIVALKDKKIPLKHLLGSEEKRLFAGAKLFQTGALEEWDYLKETDNKIRSFAVYETSSLLLVHWIKMKEFWQLRNTEPAICQLAYYDKRTGETTAVEGEGFIDDLSCLGHFYPMLGANGNDMFTSFWPYELREMADKWRAKGKAIDKNLADVLSETTDNDNPVIIKVHLR